MSAQHGPYSWADAMDEIDRLAAQLRETHEALEEAEWNGSAWIGLETCPVCGNERVKGHDDACSLGAALAGPLHEAEQGDA